MSPPVGDLDNPVNLTKAVPSLDISAKPLPVIVAVEVSVLYPEPALVIVVCDITPSAICEVAVATVLALGSVIVTVGAEE